MKVVFLDRDGVINEDPGGWTKYEYVTKWNEFRFLPGALEALRTLKEHGYKVFVVSNQAGVGKGYFRKEELEAVDRKMIEEVRRSGGDIEASYYCIHREEEGCACRKPKTGLFDKARGEYDIDAEGAYFVGDTKRDIAAGERAGLKTILVLSGKASAEEVTAWGARPHYIARDLRDAVDRILKAKAGGR